ncbi:MAG: DUF885 family protein, partial [Planctomycetes bacterium]|nr:DUF885 family protein [Planctomycetota bacterium]
YQPETRPKSEMPVLSVHEAVPGHHLQISIAMEVEAMPEFQKHAGTTAFTEGWGLYSEELAKDMGFYTDPYSDFGRLGMELWRACRLVVELPDNWTRSSSVSQIPLNDRRMSRSSFCGP